MRTAMRAFVIAAVAILLMLSAASVHAQTPGAACSAADENSPYGSTSALKYLRCISSVWTIQAVQAGTATDSCASGAAGQVQWTGTKMQFCDGSSWR